MDPTSGDPPAISARLAQLAEACRGRDVRLGELLTIGDESEDAYFLLLLLLSLPFCQPVPMLGLSTPFGIAIAGIGWAMVRGKTFVMPARAANATVPHRFIPSLISGAGKMVGWLERHLKTRNTDFVRRPAMRRVHGLVILFWALLLALPLPIPFSNIFAALPLPPMAAALLRDDGVMMARAYGVSLLCLAYWIAVPILGYLGILKIFH